MKDADIDAMSGIPDIDDSTPESHEAMFRKDMQENMEELEEGLASLFDIRDRGFAQNLCDFYRKKGYLSSKQLYWATKFWMEISGGGEKKGIEKLAVKHKTPAIPPRISVDGKILTAYFNNAARKLETPKIRYKILPKPIRGCEQLVFYRTGERSHSPWSIGVTDGLVYPNNHILAMIYQDGRTIFYPYTFDKQELQLLIKRVAEDPLHMFSENGKLTNMCCYCGRTLTHKSSVFYGYGPVCADNFGLPWGDLPPAHQQLSIGLKAPVDDFDDDIPF